MKISIKDIENAKNKELNIYFEEIIEDIESTAPITANLILKDLNHSILVSGNFFATLNLQCNRCLQNFEYEIEENINETYYKNKFFEEYKQERELSKDALVEDLNESNEIDITDLIYQSVILSIPNECVCDINCKGEAINLEKYMYSPEKSKNNVFNNIKLEKE